MGLVKYCLVFLTAPFRKMGQKKLVIKFLYSDKKWRILNQKVRNGSLGFAEFVPGSNSGEVQGESAGLKKALQRSP